MAKNKDKKKKNATMSTQTHLRIAEIRDDTLVLKSGGLRSILKVSSINFNLKSEQEQNAIIASYQGFLNSLEFPIQILIKSKKLDLDDYIEQVEEIAEKQENKLLKEQTTEYAEYIKKLVEYADIMEKQFYVIVPYEPGVTSVPSSANMFQSFFQRLAPKDSFADVKKRHTQFDKYKKALIQRVNVVFSGLENCGLKVEELKTAEIIELFYNSYNPVISRSSKVKELQDTDLETGKEEAATESEEK